MIVSSGLGSFPVPGMTAYSASKSFVSFLAEGLATEYAD
jgi:short-subunit dehydrogenase